MLEAKNIVKVYRTKKSQAIKALDKVDISFPEKGMVFLLGKSGCGKSTLLHILGGLDQCSEGELIICGTSSRKFTQKDYDAYRNTYVGFVFQDYNVLEDYSVGANIALAIQLQGRQPSAEEIRHTLIQVGMEGMEERSPNELSGGERQRIAIARALVKKPQIILADEPTGALDSDTGFQVLETLKKLSETKLVIVASHEREFAEKYADRIIELSDGRIIRDTTSDKKNNTIPEASSDKTDDIIPETSSDETDDIIPESSSDETDNTIPETSSHTFLPIYSRIPQRTALRIGTGGLCYNRFRLFLVILLSSISFALFGLADSLSSFDETRAYINSLYDNHIKTGSVSMKKYRDDINSHIVYPLSQEQMDKLEEQTGMFLTGIYEESDYMSLQYNMNTSALNPLSAYAMQIQALYGFVEVDEDALKQYGYRLTAGRLPDGNKNEVAISNYVYELFGKGGYVECPETSDTINQAITYATVSKPEDLIGNPILLNGKNYEITGIVDTMFDMDRYQHLQTITQKNRTLLQIINDWLYQEFEDYHRMDLTSIAMVGSGFVERRLKENGNPHPILGQEACAELISSKYIHESLYLSTLEEVDQKRILWMKEPKSVLGKKEVILVFRENESFRYAKTDEENAADETIYNKDGTIDYRKTFQNTAFHLQVAELRDSVRRNLWKEDGYYTVAGVLLLPATEYAAENSRVTNLICSDSLFERLCGSETRIYKRAFGRLPDGKNGLTRLIRFCYGKRNQDQFPLRTMVSFELNILKEPMKNIARGFLNVAWAIAIFAVLLLSNYIAVSISNRRHDIGILRAIGARNKDVFAIFMWQSVVIAFCCFLAALALALAGVVALNAFTRDQGLYVTILDFGIRQVARILFISLLAAFLACALPVYRISAEHPMDAIRER